MTSSISRRKFLKDSLLAAGTLAVGTGAVDPVHAAADEKPEPGESLVTLIRVADCTGCEECVHACRESNAAKFPTPQKPFPRMYPDRVPVADWSDKKDVTDRLSPYNWLYIQHAKTVVNGEEMEFTIPRRCMHCENPPCVKLCPWGAAKQEKNGLSRIDADICLGGSKCNKVCPWDIPQRQTGVGLYLDLLPAFAGNGVMFKCDRCFDKLEKGETPACIEACPESVQEIGPRSEMVDKAEAWAEETRGFLYGLEENGGTHTIYLSPVPFDRMAYETGKGKPHLNQAADTMANGTHLARAMLIAPVAGAAAALGKFYKRVKEDA